MVNPYTPPTSDLESQSTHDKQGRPVGSFVLGILGLVFWLLPILGLPVTITGLVFGIKALKGEQRGLAIAGVILCCLGIFLSAANAALGAYLSFTGQHPFLNQMLQQ